VTQFNKSIYYWLFTGCFLVYVMVMVGGITRLTGSGLSIVKWDLWHGTIPPTNDTDWNHVFELYKQSPQFQKVNYDFTLADFKSIFWWEYIHRLLGRVIGAVFIVPFLFFWMTKKLDKVLMRRLIIIFLLGGLQGALGWYMVASGLIDNPRVSHYRLATHLIAAFTVFGYIFWTALEYKQAHTVSSSENLLSPRVIKTFRFSYIVFLILILQIIYGAFVAGLKAGYVYNTFPLMEGKFFPEALSLGGITDNITTVQFIHRMLAYTVTLCTIYLWWKCRNGAEPWLKRSTNILLLVVLLQFTLGVITILSAVNIYAALLHQTGAFLLFAAFIKHLHLMKVAFTRMLDKVQATF
jgi:cytochrome c oxidase assembly protein subunit 15